MGKIVWVANNVHYVMFELGVAMASLGTTCARHDELQIGHVLDG